MKVAFDLDNTLAKWTKAEENINGPFWVGDPILLMIEKAKEHLDKGDEVIIFTARLSQYIFGFTEDYISYDSFNYYKLKRTIADWTEKYIGVRLDSTCIKLRDIDKFYDDKCGVD